VPFYKMILNLSFRIAENPLVKSINRGLMLIVPLIIMGSAALVINNFPLPQYQNGMALIFGDGWKSFGETVWNLTFGVMGLALSITIAYSRAWSYAQEQHSRIHPVIAALVSVLSLLIIIHQEGSGLQTTHAGVTGIFLSIVVAVLSVELFIRFHHYLNIPYKSLLMDADPVIPQALFSIIPFCLTLFLFFLFRWMLSYLGIQDINQVLIDLTKRLFNGIDSPFYSALLFVLLNQVFWFFGVHGNNVLYSVAQDIYMRAVDLNGAALATGGVPSHILTKPFLDVFVLIGGSGSTLCLLIAIFLAAKKSNTMKLAKISLLPALFNINEIMVFGLPIVLNPLFLIPFILTPLILTLLSYAATALGLVPVTIAPVNWTTPPLLGGWMATGSWRGMMMQVCNILVGVGIYYPFVVLHEQKKEKDVLHAYNRLVKTVLHPEYSNLTKLLSRNDQVGNMANSLACEIREALKKGTFFLEYQPQVDEKGIVSGVEALLRWEHTRYGRVPPQLVVALAEEKGMIRDLGRWVIAEACAELGKWNNQGISGLRMAINISPTQLQDESITHVLAEAIQKNRLNPRDLELEITETMAFATDQKTMGTLTALKKLGVTIAMDDFGMGHASLYCMRYFNLDKIKIDGSLTKDVVMNKSCQDIISSITYLAESMQVKVIAEYVENIEQVDLLKRLGCLEFQGYFFSPPLQVSQCLAYLTRNISPGGQKLGQVKPIRQVK